MELIGYLFLCLIGFALLIYAADTLVDGASNIAMSFGVTKTVVGLTIVAMGTSLPELVVSTTSSLHNNAALSLGNVVGSNIMNVALILGVCAIICPIASEKSMVKRDVPIMILVSALAWYFAYTDKIVSSKESAVLLVLCVAYFIMTYYFGKKEADEEAKAKAAAGIKDDSESEVLPPLWFSVIAILIGFVGLIEGGDFLVTGSVKIAELFGVSDELIGLTLVAIGTSLPELATSVVAARKGQSGMAVGNVVGSNIFNILAIIGVAGVIPGIGKHVACMPSDLKSLVVSPEMVSIHMPIMFLVALGLLPILKTDMKITRAEGITLFLVYSGYTAYLIYAH